MKLFGDNSAIHDRMLVKTSKNVATLETCKRICNENPLCASLSYNSQESLCYSYVITPRDERSSEFVEKQPGFDLWYKDGY